MKGKIADDIAEFIVRDVDSLELLEILALLLSQPLRDWEIFELDAAIRSSPASIEKRLAQLMRLGIASRIDENPPRFRYAPQDAKLAAISQNVTLAYQSRRVEITELIYSKPMKEIVSFSNAFKLRGGKKKDG